MNPYFWIYHLTFRGRKTKTGMFSTPDDFLIGDTEANCLAVCQKLCKTPRSFERLKRYFFRSVSHNMLFEAVKDINEKRSSDRPGNDWPGT